MTDFSHGMQKKLALAAAVIHGPKVLFLDEPFEGVDAIAAGMLKAMLQGMINRGATIFLTTHVLEIVERLCSHVAIIHQGRLVANGSLEELRAGVASTLPGARGRAAAHARRDLPLHCGRGRQPGAGAGAVMAGINGAGMNGTGKRRTAAGEACDRRRIAEPAGARAICGAGQPALAHVRQRPALQAGRVRAGRAHRCLCDVRHDGTGLGVGRGRDCLSWLASGQKWQYLPIVFWVVCFIWQVVPIMLASFQEQFDLGSLLRFPVRLPAPSFCSTWSSGSRMCRRSWAGSAAWASWSASPLARPELFAWTALVLAVFAAFNILLVRAVFAWIDRWLSQRKTREILGAVFMVLVLSLQLLNPAIWQHGHRSQGEPRPAAGRRSEQIAGRAMGADRRTSAAVASAGAGRRLRCAGRRTAAGARAGIAGSAGALCAGAGGVLGLRLRAEYRGENLGAAPARKKAAASPAKQSRPRRTPCAKANAPRSAFRPHCRDDRKGTAHACCAPCRCSMPWARRWCWFWSSLAASSGAVRAGTCPLWRFRCACSSPRWLQAVVLQQPGHGGSREFNSTFFLPRRCAPCCWPRTCFTPLCLWLRW